MMVMVDVRFSGMNDSPVLRADIERHARWLAGYVRDVSRCDVLVSPVRHRENRVAVRVRVTLPNGDVCNAGGQPCDAGSRDDSHLVIDEAFDEMLRRVQALNRKLQGKARCHQASARGRVDRLCTENRNG
ncbi:MAG: hypothetical protein DWQ08_09055, partial [Proteobacteria bacterium]